MNRILSDPKAMARATRKGGKCGKKHYGGRKHTTRRTKHKHTKTCKHARRGGKKSGHKKRKHTRRGRKMRGGKDPLPGDVQAATVPGGGGSSNPNENAWVSVARNTGHAVNNAAHIVGNAFGSAVSHLNPASWHW